MKALCGSTLFWLENGFHDIRDVVRFASPWPWLIAAAVIVIIAAVFWYLRRQAALEAARRATYREPPHQTAQRELEKLRRTGADLTAETFTVRVSGVLRRYLEEALKLPAPERTTEEFLQELNARSDFDSDLQDELSDFLQQSDLVKFARQDLSSEQRDRLLSCAFKVIEATVPANEPGAT